MMFTPTKYVREQIANYILHLLTGLVQLNNIEDYWKLLNVARYIIMRHSKNKQDSSLHSNITQYHTISHNITQYHAISHNKSHITRISNQLSQYDTHSRWNKSSKSSDNAFLSP